MTGIRRRLLTALAAGLAVAASVPGSNAQQTGAPFPLAMGRERAGQLVTAMLQGRAYVAGEVVVKFRPGAQPASRSRALSVLRRSAETAPVRFIGDAVVLQVPGEPDAEAAARVLASQPEVEWAAPNYVRRLNARPNDPQYSLQWNFDVIDLPRAWDINPGATSDIVVGVIDTGVTTVTTTFSFRLWTGSSFEEVPIAFGTNPDIGTGRILPGRDFALWDGPVLDLDGHGTHVAGTLLQETNNSAGVAGVAYNAKLMPLKACLGFWDVQIILAALDIEGYVPPDTGGCSDTAVAEALRWGADNGAQVINISLGGGEPAPLVIEALRYAVARGVFVSIAAGNEFQDGNPVSYPAAYAAELGGAVSVGAIGRSRRRASYSNTGPHLELMAPGGDFGDGGRDGVIWQVGLLFTDFLPAPTVTRPRFDRYELIGAQGTSMAAPHVAGAASLLRSQGITSPAAIEAALKRFATDLGTAGRDDEYGHGLINPRGSLRGMGLAR